MRKPKPISNFKRTSLISMLTKLTTYRDRHEHGMNEAEIQDYESAIAWLKGLLGSPCSPTA